MNIERQSRLQKILEAFFYPAMSWKILVEENFFTYGLELSFLTENSIYDHNFQKN